MLFDPSPEEIAKGENLFRPDRKHEIKFLKSAVFTEHLPHHDLPEVVLVVYSLLLNELRLEKNGLHDF